MNRRNVLEARLSQLEQELADARAESASLRRAKADDDETMAQLAASLQQARAALAEMTRDSRRHRELFLRKAGEAVAARFDAMERDREWATATARLVAECAALRADAEAHRAAVRAGEKQAAMMCAMFPGMDEPDPPPSDEPVSDELLALVFRACETCGSEEYDHDAAVCALFESRARLELALAVALEGGMDLDRKLLEALDERNVLREQVTRALALLPRCQGPFGAAERATCGAVATWQIDGQLYACDAHKPEGPGGRVEEMPWARELAK